MKISKLQKHILIYGYATRANKISRQGLERFYNNYPHKPKDKDIQNTITKSLERLIDKEMLIGYGRRTPHKWFFDEIRLTPKGRKTAKKLLGEQQILPFKILKRRK